MHHARANLVTPTTRDGAATRNPRASSGGGTDMQRAIGAPAAINRAAPLALPAGVPPETSVVAGRGGARAPAFRDASGAGVPNDTRAETRQERMQSTGFRGHPGRQEHIRAKIERVQGNIGRPCSDRVLSRYQSREGAGLPRTGAGETAHGDAAPARCGASAPTAPTKTGAWRRPRPRRCGMRGSGRGGVSVAGSLSAGPMEAREP